MDISYLLFLQNFRNGIHDAWTPFLESISLFAITYIILLPVFIYWCINKRNGIYTLGAAYVCVAINAVLKLTVCAYRPWIRDPRIIPAGNAITTATGYSFPSGHTAYATPIYGGLAVGFWEKKITRWLSVLCVIAILITGFSRNYLGVHTPQDVAVGLLLAALSLFVANWVIHHPEQENKFLLGGVIGCVLALLYISFKPYPMDYVDGKLLVDPSRMMNDGFHDIGALIAFCTARYIEKQWINFKATGFTCKGIVLALIGFVPLCLMIMHLRPPFVAWLGPHWGLLVAHSIIIFYIVALYPLVLKIFENKH
ncbi:phosphatase PAP2 family protein [Candidatus Avelusimicrobium luingense]|uniref:phosphatase PAP2 family protein n=1 Tax=Candidatus Avelusimicrobium luingense TaxID=3416211 RepID=UPI003D0B2D56